MYFGIASTQRETRVMIGSPRAPIVASMSWRAAAAISSSEPARTPAPCEPMNARSSTVPSGARPVHLRELTVQALIVSGSPSATRNPWPTTGAGNWSSR